MRLSATNPISVSFSGATSGAIPPCGGPRAAQPSEGLVTSKTSRQTFVNLAPSAMAERRVNRLKRSVWASGHLHGLAENGFRPSVPWFVTLTYKGVDDWRPNHLSKATERFRNWCRKTGLRCRYTWVAELQGRGAVHYHLLCWLPPGVRMPHWDRPIGRRRAFWEYGMTNTERARSGVGYLMKYLSKLGELTRFPKSLRLYGVAGLTEQGRAVRSWYNLPEWAKRSFGVGDLVRRCGRLIVDKTGEILESPYVVKVAPSGLTITQLRDIPERFHDGAYSSWGVP